ncbi:hypothetical protein R3P38DRAFT_3349944 [Favolaschia claudopus]|uniref:Uncharacterized protein n=1 Tax=Favolaschia claudopus TaxID=2862362 RepID=A0AAW0CLQ5_9AGAR
MSRPHTNLEGMLATEIDASAVARNIVALISIARVASVASDALAFGVERQDDCSDESGGESRVLSTHRFILLNNELGPFYRIHERISLLFRENTIAWDAIWIRTRRVFQSRLQELNGGKITSLIPHSTRLSIVLTNEPRRNMEKREPADQTRHRTKLVAHNFIPSYHTESMRPGYHKRQAQSMHVKNPMVISQNTAVNPVLQLYPAEWVVGKFSDFRLTVSHTHKAS